MPAFAQAFADLLLREDLVDRGRRSPGPAGPPRRHPNARLVLVKLGLISESDLCASPMRPIAGCPLVGADDIPDQPVLADRLKLPFLKANRLLPISFDGRRLLIATADPFVDEAAKAISYMLEVRSISP